MNTPADHEPPKTGEILVFDENEARGVFTAWLRNDALRDEIALVSFRQQALQAQKNGWLQARWHEEGESSVDQFLSYCSVWDVNPFEVGARRPVTRKAFRQNRTVVLRLLDVRKLLERPLIVLSNGEMRRVLIARALLKTPKILVLDDPAAGLDRKQVEKLKTIILALAKRGMAVAMSYRHADEIPQATAPGEPKTPPAQATSTTDAPLRRKRSRKPVIEISGLTLSFGSRKLFENFSWTVCEGERWLLCGENGSGKSTLLSLICGDNPYAYACDIKVLGMARKPGCPIASIRERIGMASAEMQAYLGVSALEALERALCAKRDILLLDEPFMNMSASERNFATRKISAYLKAHKSTAAILVSHRRAEAPAEFTRVIDLDR